MDILTKALDIYDNKLGADGEAEGDLDHLEDDNDRGNKFQKENAYNKLLPYDITLESQKHLLRIKTNLATCVELDQETIYHTLVDLDSYLDIYGLALTKEDHIYFVKLLYQLIVSKNSVDLLHISLFARCFHRMMRKTYLIASEELQLDWRPLFETYERLLYSQTELMGLKLVPEYLESNLSSAIRVARPYFTVESTKEMLEEWRPMLCPFSVGRQSIQRAVKYLSLFLPTTLPPEHHDKGFKLWFDEIMHFWLDGKVDITFLPRFTLLLSRLSSDCLGFIDWEPYIPRIFNHFRVSFNLCGTTEGHMGRSHEQMDVSACVTWMVYMIYDNSSCLDHIISLFKSIESYYHPSNSDGRWIVRLQQFLWRLPACYVRRLARERVKQTIWRKRLKESHKLRDEHTERFVDAILPVVLTSMFNQNSHSITSSSLAFRDLSVMRPEKVIPPILDRIYGSYETLIEPHRLLASLNCMSSVVPAMVKPCKYFPQGPSNVVPLLLNSLPGIDSNDMKKCVTVFRFVATLAAHIRLKDYSYLVDQKPELTYEQQQLCLSTAQFEDFVVQFLDKCFVLIENTARASFSNLDQEFKSRNSEENVVEAAIGSVTLSILAQSSKEIQLAALDKIHSYVTRNMFDTKTQGRAIATLCLGCAKSTPKETLEKLVPHFGRLILTLTDHDEVFQDSNLDDELLFSLLLMSEIVRCNSPHILEYKDLIVNVLDRALNLTCKEGYMLGCSILRHLLRASTNIACCDWRNIDFDDETNKQNEENWPFDNWGHTTHIKDLKLRWHKPGPELRQFARELLERFLKQAMDELLAWVAGEREQLQREQVQRCLHIILSCLVGGASVLPHLSSEVIKLCPFEVDVTPMVNNNNSNNFKSLGTEPLEILNNINVRSWIVESALKILNHIITVNGDDIKSQMLVCEIFRTALSYFGYNKTEISIASKRIKSMKDSSHNKLLGSKRHLRYLLAERVAQQHRIMLLNRGRSEFTELHFKVFESMFELSQSHYVEVRMVAQDILYTLIAYHPYLDRRLVTMLVRELKNTEIEHDKFKGLLNLVYGGRNLSSIVINPNWGILFELWPAIIQSPHSEKPSIVRLLDKICCLVNQYFNTFELCYKFNDSTKRLAASLWTMSNMVEQNEYQRPSESTIAEVGLKVSQRNDKRVEDYKRLVAKLVELIDDPHMHWHRRIVAYTFFGLLMRDDHSLPLEGLKLCLSSLISERLAIRSKAIQLVSAQLKLHKREHTKRTIKLIQRGFARTPESCPSDQTGSRLDQLSQETKRMSLDEPQGTSSTRPESMVNVDGLKVGQEQLMTREDEPFKADIEQLDKPGFIEKLCNSNKWLQYKLTDKTYTKDEWNKLIFIDKPHVGFYDWPKELKIYEPYDKQPQLDRPADQLNEHELAIYNVFQDADFVEKLVGYLCFEETTKGPMADPGTNRFDVRRPTIIKDLFRNYGPCMLEPFKKYLDEYSTSTCEHKQRFVIEFLAGIIRGSKHWSYEMLLDLRQFIHPLLERVTITQENFNDWTGLVNFVFRKRDIKRFEWLLHYFVTKAISPAEIMSPTITPFLQARRLTLAHHALLECEWRAADHIFPIVIESLKSQDHLLAYTNVRTSLARIYSLMYVYDDAEVHSRIPGTLIDVPKRREFIEWLLPRLAILETSKRNLVQNSSSASSSPPHNGDTMATSPPSQNAEAIEIAVSSTSSSGQMRTSASANDLCSAVADEPEERKEAIKLMKLAAGWLAQNVCRLRSRVPGDFFKLMPVICEMSREKNDPELRSEYLASVGVLWTSTLSPDAIDEALICIRKIIAKHSWHARVAVPGLIALMISSNMFNLLNNQHWRTQLEDIVINYLICDERVDVRESTCQTLSGMIHCEFTLPTSELLAEFKRRANEPLMKRKQPNGMTIIDPKSIVMRHSGILCLCACVDAHPYCVPEYLPDILTFLSDYVTDPQPISTTIKKTMSNFRRTHHDNWQSDKTKFTDDQLCILADLLVSPSYYA